MGNNNTAGIFIAIPAILLLLLLSFSSPLLSVTKTVAQQTPLTPPSLTPPITPPLASAQEESTSSPPLPPTLPFTPFSLQQQQETVPEEEGIGNTTGTTTAATPATNDTEGGVTELQASASEPPLIAEIITNATQAVAPATIRLDANITGGAPPYTYSWSSDLGLIDQDRSITLNFFEPGTFTYLLTATDARGKIVNDAVQIVISERRLPPTEGIVVSPEPGGIAPPQEGGVPLTVEIIPNATQGFAPATFQFNSKVIGGTEPYNYQWKLPFRNSIFSGAQLVAVFITAGTYTVILNVTDSTGRAGSDSVEITVGGLSELPPSDLGEVVPPSEGGGGVLLPPETGQEGQPPGGGSLPGTTTPAANDTGGNDTGGGVTEQPLTVEIIPNATEGFAPATIAFDSKVTGGTAPYTYQWSAVGVILEAEFRNAAGFVKELPYPNTFYFILNVTDSNGQTASDTVAIYIKEQPSEGGGEVLLPPETGQEGQPPGALLSQTPPPPPPNDNGEVISPPPEGGGEGAGGTPSPPSDDMQEGGEEGTPPPSSTTEEEPPTNDTGGG
jgi:hypothetical protein